MSRANIFLFQDHSLQAFFPYNTTKLRKNAIGKNKNGIITQQCRFIVFDDNNESPCYGQNAAARPPQPAHTSLDSQIFAISSAS